MSFFPFGNYKRESRVLPYTLVDEDHSKVLSFTGSGDLTIPDSGSTFEEDWQVILTVESGTELSLVSGGTATITFPGGSSNSKLKEENSALWLTHITGNTWSAYGSSTNDLSGVLTAVNGIVSINPSLSPTDIMLRSVYDINGDGFIDSLTPSFAPRVIDFSVGGGNDGDIFLTSGSASNITLLDSGSISKNIQAFFYLNIVGTTTFIPAGSSTIVSKFSSVTSTPSGAFIWGHFDQVNNVWYLNGDLDVPDPDLPIPRPRFRSELSDFSVDNFEDDHGITFLLFPGGGGTINITLDDATQLGTDMWSQFILKQEPATINFLAGGTTTIDSVSGNTSMTSAGAVVRAEYDFNIDTWHIWGDLT